MDNSKEAGGFNFLTVTNMSDFFAEGRPTERVAIFNPMGKSTQANSRMACVTDMEKFVCQLATGMTRSGSLEKKSMNRRRFASRRAGRQQLDPMTLDWAF